MRISDGSSDVCSSDLDKAGPKTYPNASGSTRPKGPAPGSAGLSPGLQQGGWRCSSQAPGSWKQGPGVVIPTRSVTPAKAGAASDLIQRRPRKPTEIGRAHV